MRKGRAGAAEDKDPKLKSKLLGKAKIAGRVWSFYITDHNSWRFYKYKNGRLRDIGKIYYDQGKIYIADNLSMRERLTTIIHEVIHAILHKDFDGGSAEMLACRIDEEMSRALSELGLINFEVFGKI